MTDDPIALPLRGTVAIVTGGGRGLGRAMALGLAGAGANVVATSARAPREVEAVAAEAAEAGRGHVLPLVADVTRPEDCAATVAAALDRFGRLDVLVNNAGRGMKLVSDAFLTVPTRFWEVDPEVWRDIVDTNVNGPFLMARAAAPTLLREGRGRIVNVSMNYETMRRAGFSPYGPSKAALESETVIWARDFSGTGVTVNAPLLWLASEASDGFTGRRVDAKLWRRDLDPAEAARRASSEAGWGVPPSA